MWQATERVCVGERVSREGGKIRETMDTSFKLVHRMVMQGTVIEICSYVDVRRGKNAGLRIRLCRIIRMVVVLVVMKI